MRVDEAGKHKNAFYSRAFFTDENPLLEYMNKILGLSFASLLYDGTKAAADLIDRSLCTEACLLILFFWGQWFVRDVLPVIA